MPFQRCQRPHHGRQRSVKLVRGTGQAARLDDPHKGFHRSKLVHGTQYYSINWSSPLSGAPFIQRRETAKLGLAGRFPLHCGIVRISPRPGSDLQFEGKPDAPATSRTIGVEKWLEAQPHRSWRNAWGH
jgi:hypothetical protein